MEGRPSTGKLRGALDAIRDAGKKPQVDPSATVASKLADRLEKASRHANAAAGFLRRGKIARGSAHALAAQSISAAHRDNAFGPGRGLCRQDRSMNRVAVSLASAVFALSSTSEAAPSKKNAYLHWYFSYGDSSKGEVTVVEITDTKEHLFKVFDWNCYVVEQKSGDMKGMRQVECDYKQPEGPSIRGSADCLDGKERTPFHAVLMGPHANPFWSINLECKWD